MKEKIDSLYQGIIRDLARKPPALPEIAAALMLVGADNLNQAKEKRALLERWACDEGLPPGDSFYARVKLDELPDF